MEKEKCMLVQEALKRVDVSSTGLKASIKNDLLSLKGSFKYTDIEEIVGHDVYNFEELLEIFDLETVSKIADANPKGIMNKKIFKNYSDVNVLLDVARYSKSAYRIINECNNISIDQQIGYYYNLAEHTDRISFFSFFLNYYYGCNGYTDFVKAAIKYAKSPYERTELFKTFMVEISKQQIDGVSDFSKDYEMIQEVVNEGEKNWVNKHFLESIFVYAANYLNDVINLFNLDELKDLFENVYYEDLNGQELTISEIYLLASVDNKYIDEFFKKYTSDEVIDDIFSNEAVFNCFSSTGVGEFMSRDKLLMDILQNDKFHIKEKEKNVISAAERFIKDPTERARFLHILGL